MKTFSFILPAYNAQAYLPFCLTSVTHQTYPDWEVIVIDDGSTDATGEIADAFAQADDRVRVIHQSNHGQAQARNIGIEHAQGEWLVFIDADDHIDAHYLERIAVVVPTNGDIVQLTGRYFRMTAPWTRCIRRSWYLQQGIRFNESMRHYEDVLWTVDLWQAKGRVIHHPINGYHYNAHVDSNSHSSSPQAKRLLFQSLRHSFSFSFSLIYLYLRLTLHFLLHR